MDLPSVAAGVLLALAVIAAFAIAARRKGRGEGFVSRRAEALHAAAQALFAEGRPSFTELRRRVPGGVDAVTYTDLLGLWRRGRLTPAEVEKALA